MHKSMAIKIHLYDIYDRLLEDCYSEIVVQYNENAIIKDRGVNKNNTNILSIQFYESTYDYLKAKPFDINRIKHEIEMYLKDYKILEEEMCEQMSDVDYYHMFPQYANSPEHYKED